MDELFWRDEILQVMYWLRGEKLGERVRMADLLPLLSCSADDLYQHLQRAVDDELIEREPDTAGLRDGDIYTLSKHGAKAGAQSFADEFEGMIKPAHAECPPN